MGWIDKIIKRSKWQVIKYTKKSLNIDLTHHLYVCGLTGTGKTNTVMYLLEKKYSDIPYLVIEPTCARQYRNLSLSNRSTHIYSIGEDQGESIELNPFYIPYKTDFTSHIELLKACFASVISSKEPLVYRYMDRAISEIYYDKGWDRVTHLNKRLKDECDYQNDEHFFYFPRMRDLYDKVIDLSKESDFQAGGENKGTIIELLKSNIRIFIDGPLGKCFNTYKNKFYDIFNDNIVFEIPNPEAAATIGVLNILLGSVIHIANNRPVTDELRHITVFEEAQLLFSADDQENKGRNDTAKKLEHLLSTGRKFGEGIIIVNQDPTAIHKSVLGNIRQRFIHKINSSEICNSLAKDYSISSDDIISTERYKMWYCAEREYKALQWRVGKVKSIIDRDIKHSPPNYILGYAGLDNIEKQIVEAINFRDALSNSGQYELEINRFHDALRRLLISQQCVVNHNVLPEYMAFLTCIAIVRLQFNLTPGIYDELGSYYRNIVLKTGAKQNIPDALSVSSLKLYRNVLQWKSRK